MLPCTYTVHVATFFAYLTCAKVNFLVVNDPELLMGRGEFGKSFSDALSIHIQRAIALLGRTPVCVRNNPGRDNDSNLNTFLVQFEKLVTQICMGDLVDCNLFVSMCVCVKDGQCD